MKVYEGNWSAKNRDHLIWRIKMKQKEIDQHCKHIPCNNYMDLPV